MTEQPQDNGKPGYGSFDDLLDRHEKPIFNLIYRLTGNYDEASDLTQETFVAVYRSLHAFRGESDVFTWICRIAVNKCKNRFKERSRKRRFEFLLRDLKHEDEYAVEGEDGAFGVEERTPLTELEQKELQDKIMNSISALPEDYRIIVVLRDLQGLSYHEIANMVGISLEAVKSRLHRGRMILRQKLGTYLQG